MSQKCGRLSILSLALAGAFAAMTSSHVMADTIVSTSGSPSAVANTSAQSIVSVTGSGALGGFSTGVANFNGGSIGTLSNSGAIIGNRWAVSNLTTIDTITNSGTIGNSGPFNSGTVAGQSSYGIFNGGIAGTPSNATITILSNSGNITGTNYGIYNGSAQIGGTNAGTIGTLSNSGTINGTIGIYNGSVSTIGTLNNNAGGTINGASASGVQNSGTIGTLTNTGTISGNAAGVNSGGSITRLDNSGLIQGGNAGITVGSGTITALNNNGGTIIAANLGIDIAGAVGTLTNTGLVKGTIAISVQNTGAIGMIANNGGTIAGSISNAGGVLNFSGGTGSIFGTLTGFSGGVGRISSSADIVFNSGNLLLNDNIDFTSGNGTVTNSATLQANNRVTIVGNFTQSAGGVLLLGVTNPPNNNPGDITDTGYGRLVVIGDAVLASGSSVSLKSLGYAFAQGQRYVALATTGALSASGVNYSAAGFNVTAATQTDTSSSGFTDLILTLGGPASNSPVNNATDGNASAALGGLFNYTGNNAGLLSVFNPAAALGTSGAANKAGAQLSPAATGSAAVQAAQSATQGVADVANAHIDTLRVAQASGSNSGNSGIATGERPTDVAVWGQAFGGQSTQNDRAGAAGYKAGVNGMLVGVDTAVSDQWRVGGLVDYANISIANTGDNTGSSGHVTSYGVLGYAGYAADTWYLNLSAGATTQKYNTLRAVNFAGFAGGASGSFDGTNYSASAQAGYPIKLDAATTLTPIGGLMYQRLHQDGYTETGSAAALQIGSASTTSIKSDLGAKLERVFKTSYGDMTPSAQLSWRHEYRDTVLRSVASFAADTTGSTGFVSQGIAPEKDTGVLVLGVTLARSQNMTLSAHYTLEAAGGYTSQIADVKLRYAF